MSKLEDIEAIVAEKFGMNAAVAIFTAVASVDVDDVVSDYGTFARDAILELRKDL